MDFYLKVFLESAHAASIIPLSSDATFFAMRSFGGFNMALAAILAIAGSALGAAFNFILGYILLKIYRKKPWKFLTKEQYSNAYRFFSKYGIALLPFSWLPLFNFLVVIAGFLNISAFVALPLVIAGQAAYYSYYLFY